MQSIDYLIAPKESYIKIAAPTADLIKRLLATIKSCQQENLEYESYQVMLNKIIDSFIKSPMEL